MVTLSTANDALKTMYLDVVANQLNSNIHPFLSKIEKTSVDVVGKQVSKLVPFGVNGGVGAGTETGALPQSGYNNYLRFNSSLKNLYGTIEISDKALRASSNEAGAFVNLLNAELEGMLDASRFNMARMLYGDGSGLLATGHSSAAGVYTFVVDSLKNIMVGMTVDVYVEGVFSHTARIVGWNYGSKTITFDTVATADMANEDKTISLYLQQSKNKEITGVKALFNASTLYGVTVADYAFLKPQSKTVTSASFGVNSLMELVDTISEETGGDIDFICGSFDARRKYQSVVASKSLNVDVLSLDGGYKAISFNGIPFVADRFVDSGTVYMLNSKDFKLHQLCDWEWICNDKGQILRQKEGYPVHSATLVKYAELICDKPGAQGKLVIS